MTLPKCPTCGAVAAEQCSPECPARIAATRRRPALTVGEIRRALLGYEDAEVVEFRTPNGLDLLAYRVQWWDSLFACGTRRPFPVVLLAPADELDAGLVPLELAEGE
jgi:hypothetical protein